MRKHEANWHLSPCSLAIGTKAAYALLHVIEQCWIKRLFMGTWDVLAFHIESTCR